MMVLASAALLLTLCADVVLSECSVGCLSCFGSNCTSCESSYYFLDGLCTKCPMDCNSCNNFDDCTSCQPTKYGLHARCTFNCNGNCLNGECQDNTGYCVKCIPGFYGFQCKQNCSLCSNNQCDLHKCSQDCRRGYYEYTTATGTFCLQCSSNCKHCKDGKTCYECNDGYNLYKFKNGDIICAKCFQLSQCSDFCIIQDCNKCLINNNSLVCTDCPEGQRFDGNTCVSNTTSCSQACSTDCNSYGMCFGECDDGWTGEKCSYKCDDRCLKCSKNNGYICQVCKGDYYRNDCSLVCNPSCIKELGKQTCNHIDGYCLNGCIPGFWGESCNLSCSDGCTNLVCDRSTGKCVGICNDGYIGETCVETTTGSTKDLETQTEIITTTTTNVAQLHSSCNETKIFVIGLFSGIGISAVIVVLAILLLILGRRYVRRKQSQDGRQTVEIPTYYNTNTDVYTSPAESSNAPNIYERLGNNRGTDMIYGELKPASRK